MTVKNEEKLMKKRFLLVFFSLFILGSRVFAQNFDLKTYSDYTQCFSGAAAALFLGEMEIEMKTEFETKLDLINIAVLLYKKGITGEKKCQEQETKMIYYSFQKRIIQSF